MRRCARWSEYDINFVLSNHKSMTVYEIADALGKTASAVQHKVNRLGISCIEAPQPRAWSDDEISTLLDRYETTPSDVIAAELGRTYNAVVSKMVEMGIRRSDEAIKVNQSNKVQRNRLPSDLTHKQRVKIINQVSYATQCGAIVKSPCAVCGDTKVEAHHEDYYKPLDIVFLCHHHHMRLHRLKNQAVVGALELILSLRKIYEVA